MTEWDESGYLAIALDNVHALRAGGPVDLVDVVLGQGVQAPLVPLSAVPLNLMFGAGVDSSLLVQPLFHALLVLATYGLARRLVEPWWAVLAAGVVGSLPLLIDFARLFHFAVPAAALFTAALWALLRAEGMTRRGWAITAGGLIGLALLARTMTLAYVPGLVLAAALPLLAESRLRRERVINLIAFGATAVLVAATWYLPNARTVGHYLLDFGYGAESASYGAERSPLSVGYWTAELRGVVTDLYLPLAAVLVVCLLAAAVSALARDRDWSGGWAERLRWLALTPAAALGVVLAGGYLALTSSSNDGTAFSLPLLPAVVVLVVAATASIRARGARLALAAALAAVAVFNVAMKSGSLTQIAGPSSADVPGIGAVAVADARGLIQAEVEAAGYPVGEPTEPLPELQREWLPFAERAVRSMTELAERRGHRAFLASGFDDLLLSNTRFALASELALEQRLPTVFLKPFPDGDTAASYRAQLRRAGPDLLITGEPGPAAAAIALTRAEVETAARAVGFEVARRFTLPDGRALTLWYRDVEPPAKLYD